MKESQLEVKMEKNGDKMEKKKKPIIKSSLVDHTYYDYSTHELSEILSTAEVKQKCRVTFPVKLHAIISKPEYKHIICWQPHGRSWKVLDNKLLAEVVCKENFNHDSFSSFNRSVNGWGFKRLVRQGPDCKSYYHELFLRGRPELAQAMTRLVDPGKRIPDRDGEPDFYDIAKRFPLPEDPYTETARPNDPEGNSSEAERNGDNSKHSSDQKRQAGAPIYEQPAVKRHHNDRNSFPPDGYANPSGFQHHSHFYHPYHPPYAYHHGYPSSYGHHHIHHSYSYGSPERHYGYDHHWRARHSYDNVQRAYYNGQNHHQYPAFADASSQVDRYNDHSRSLHGSTHVRPPIIHRGDAASSMSHPRDNKYPDIDKGRKSILKLEFSEQKPTKIVISAAGIQAAEDFEQQKPTPEDQTRMNNDKYSSTSIAPDNINSRTDRTDSLGSVYEYFMGDDVNVATTAENDNQQD